MELHELAESDDPSFVALSLILAAWDEGTENGVAPEQMAYAALFTALSDLVSHLRRRRRREADAAACRSACHHRRITLKRTVQ